MIDESDQILKANNLLSAISTIEQAWDYIQQNIESKDFGKLVQMEI